MIVTAICAEKGGIGKTTAAVNLAAAFASMGYKTLLCDADPQANATLWYGIDPYNEAHIGSLMFGELPARDVIQRRGGVDVIPSSHNLAAYDMEIINKLNREGLLRKAFRQPEFTHYDYIFIDCPPELKILTANALTAAHTYLIPLLAKIFAWKGVNRVIEFASVIQEDLNPKLTLGGIFLNQYNPKIKGELKNRIVDGLRETEHGNQLLTTYIRQDIALEKCIERDQDVFAYDPESNGAHDFGQLAKELLTKPQFTHVK